MPIAATQARNFGPYCTRMTCRWSRSIYRLKGNTSRSADFTIYWFQKKVPTTPRYFSSASFLSGLLAFLKPTTVCIHVLNIFTTYARICQLEACYACICICQKNTRRTRRKPLVVGRLKGSWHWHRDVISEGLSWPILSHLSSKHSSIHLYIPFATTVYEDYG